MRLHDHCPIPTSSLFCLQIFRRKKKNCLYEHCSKCLLIEMPCVWHTVSKRKSKKSENDENLWDKLSSYAIPLNLFPPLFLPFFLFVNLILQQHLVNTNEKGDENVFHGKCDKFAQIYDHSNHYLFIFFCWLFSTLFSGL